jgi:large subunit ribosomal protein L24
MKPLVFKRSSHQPTPFKTPQQVLHVTKGDTVRVISGEFKGKDGKVLRVLPRKGKVVIEGLNVVKKHKRANQSGDEGGIIQFPAPIHVSNVMLLDPKSGEPTRIKRRKDKDGTVERVSVASGQPIPRNR